MRRNRNIEHKISGGPAHDIILSVEHFVYNTPTCSNEALHFEEMDLKKIALESVVISETTALHKVLSELAYLKFYLYLYDDTDWIGDISDFTKYATDMFSAMNLDIPNEFYSSDENVVYEAKSKYNDYFLNGLKFFVDSAFSLLWQRKSFLLDFNLKISQEIKLLKIQDYPTLQKDGQVTRATYFPKWLQNVIQLRERGLCHYCGCVVTSPSIPNQEYDIDHMVPIAQGGTNDPTNFVLSCPGCNNKKRAKLPSFSDSFSWPKRI